MRNTGSQDYLLRTGENVEVRESTLNEAHQWLESARSSTVEPASLPSERAQCRSNLNAIQPFRGKHPQARSAGALGRQHMMQEPGKIDFPRSPRRRIGSIK